MTLRIVSGYREKLPQMRNKVSQAISSVQVKVEQVSNFIHLKCGECRAKEELFNKGYRQGYYAGHKDGVKAKLFVMLPSTFYLGWKLGSFSPVDSAYR